MNKFKLIDKNILEKEILIKYRQQHVEYITRELINKNISKRIKKLIK